MADLLDNNDMGGISSEPMRRALGERYLQYALSTITNRALPDARDGLLWSVCVLCCYFWHCAPLRELSLIFDTRRFMFKASLLGAVVSRDLGDFKIGNRLIN